MTWPKFLAYLGVAVGARWLLQRFTSHADAYLFAGLVFVGATYAIYRRSRRHALLDLWLRSDDAGRQALLPTLHEAVGLRPALPVPEGAAVLKFRYPPVSRSLLNIQFWGAVLFAVGPLVALIRERESDPGNDWVLFIVASLFALAALGARRQLSWAGNTILVDARGIERQRGPRRRERIDWVDLTRVQLSRRGAPLVFTARDGHDLRVWPELIEHAQFQDVVARRLSPDNNSAANEQDHGP